MQHFKIENMPLKCAPTKRQNPIKNAAAKKTATFFREFLNPRNYAFAFARIILPISVCWQQQEQQGSPFNKV